MLRDVKRPTVRLGGLLAGSVRTASLGDGLRDDASDENTSGLPKLVGLLVGGLAGGLLSVSGCSLEGES